MSASATASASRLRPALGTFVAVACRAATEEVARVAIETAYAAIEAVDRLMHPTGAGSDLAAMCGAPIGQPVVVDAMTWQLLELSQRLHALSGGLFDPCLPDADGCMADVELSPNNVVVCRRRIAVDLGGIAKGFAVDQATQALIDALCSDGEVNAGGDVRVFGPSRRPIWVRTRNGDWPLMLHNLACATSRCDVADRPSQHRGYYDRTNAQESALPNGTVAVMAPTAAVADGLTKCVLLRERTDPCIRDLLAHFDATAKVFGSP
jgi:thiamine biosynthesis lipoprotein